MNYIKLISYALLLGCFIEIAIFNSAIYLYLLKMVGLKGTLLGFSISRIVAVVLIAIIGKFLFSLQKMPDYHIDKSKF